MAMPKRGGVDMDDMDMPMNDEPKEGAADSLGPIGGGMRDDFTAAAEEAFPEIAGDPGRIEALKSAIRICLEEDKDGGYGGGKTTKEKPKGGFALLFGAPKKK